jgi:hypothetical protein
VPAALCQLDADLASPHTAEHQRNDNYMLMLLRFVGFVAILLGCAALVVAQHRWSERMLAQVNARRPSHDQLRLWNGSLFRSWTLREEFRRTDPAEYRRAMLRFGICGAFLIAAMWWLMAGIHV